ncbi:MAG: FAD-dependent oxidoreductase [Desulfocapsa sp.]|uniref:FAD-dependent oxidoreductase n=1 Tax=Desulfotalea psychrophila TaxID=84980 RepID=A0ABS3AT48_9BACT|nr:FAD-dependent oxidoreductase [Desulfocapsa sp.]MBN4067938.1 FAD-dependent oxidoreductase [Desulfotalea psychrophila]
MSEQKDVVIIGAGPAGIQAAIHSVRKKCNVLLLGRIERSALFSAHVENYACVEGVKTGEEMLIAGMDQAKRFGTEVMEDDVLKVHQEGDGFSVELESGVTVSTRTLIFANGTSRKKLKVPGEKEFFGRGVSYCVDCDANFYRNAIVAVVGNASAAIDGALTLTGYASKVYLVNQELLASRELIEKLNESTVENVSGTWVSEIAGDGDVKTLILENGKTINLDGVFIELGAKGAMELALEIGVQLDMDTMSHIDTNKKAETNVAGVYAAGDITGHPYQMAKAVGEGCVAGMEAAVFSRKQKRNEEG